MVNFGTLTVLVGTNASGKSNLKDALRFLHGIGLGYHFSEILGGKSSPSSVLEWRGIRGGSGEIAYDDSAAFEIRCDIVPSSMTHRTYSFLRYALTVDVSDRRFGPRVVRESLSTQNTCLWDSHAFGDPPIQKGQHQIRIRHWSGGSHRRHGKVSECSSFLPAVAQLAFDSEASVTARRACAAVLEELEGIRFLDLDPDAMREPAQLGQSVLGDKGENLSSVLHGICKVEQLKEAS